MAQDYVVIEKNEENGMIAINKSVFESIANISIDDIENVVAIKQGRFNKPVDVKVKYGANVNATAELLQNKIYENILFMTGFKASDVAVNVEGFEI